jgi:hypothetical protein
MAKKQEGITDISELPKEERPRAIVAETVSAVDVDVVPTKQRMIQTLNPVRFKEITGYDYPFLMSKDISEGRLVDRMRCIKELQEEGNKYLNSLSVYRKDLAQHLTIVRKSRKPKIRTMIENEQVLIDGIIFIVKDGIFVKG